MLNEFKQKYTVKSSTKPNKTVADIGTYEGFNSLIQGGNKEENQISNGKKDITPKYNENR